MSAAQVTLRGVTKVFPAGAGGEPVHALGPIDIEIRKGEFFAVVGPSGCGKSTLLELIAGLTPPTLGQIEFEGRAIKDTFLMASAWFSRKTPASPGSMSARISNSACDRRPSPRKRKRAGWPRSSI